jgi:[protein-PII] uridylyltransferase
VRGSEGIRFVSPHAAVERPETWLSLFQAAIDQRCPVTDETLSALQVHVGRFQADAFFPTRGLREALFRFLRPRAGLYDRLSEMHDIGLLGQMLPEFKAITCRVVRDFYHKYTVDEHTLLTIRNLERLADAPERGRFGRLLAELESPELLVLALLYHDVGKALDEDHATESVRLAKGMFERLALDDDARETVEFLVRHHLQMSVVAFRRDTEDPEIVRQFASLVGTEERA